jgi:hypothetical protein
MTDDHENADPVRTSNDRRLLSSEELDWLEEQARWLQGKVRPEEMTHPPMRGLPELVLRVVDVLRDETEPADRRTNATIHYDACREHLFDAPFTGAGYECLWCFVEDEHDDQYERVAEDLYATLARVAAWSRNGAISAEAQPALQRARDAGIGRDDDGE